MLQRLRADSGSEHLRSSLQCFELERVAQGRLGRSYDPAIGSISARKACVSGICKLASALDLDVERCALEYIDIAPLSCNNLAEDAAA